MTHATPTETKSRIMPMSELVIEHRHRCLLQHECRITESPVPVTVRYRPNTLITLLVVINPEKEPKYVDANGWMFDENVLTKLLAQKKVRSII